MKKYFFILVCAISCSFTMEAQNLILNPSCDDTLVDGEIPYWQEIVGSEWVRRCADPDAFAGTCYFFSGAVIEGELEQIITISSDSIHIDEGVQQYDFSGYVRAYDQNPSDESDIYILFYNSEDTLAEFHFGPYDQTEEWLKIDSTLSAPEGSRSISIKLHTYRNNGSNNDGYFDELYLASVPVESETGIKELNSNACFSVFPNPSQGEIEISLRELPEEKTVLILTDVTGRKLKEINIKSMITSIMLDLPDGTYFATMVSDNIKYTDKIIIQR